MSKKCIYCGSGYGEDFGHTDIVQEISCSKISTRSAIYYGDWCEKGFKSNILSDKGLTLAKSILKIVPEESCLKIMTEVGENDDEYVSASLDIVCCPFCGRKFNV